MSETIKGIIEEIEALETKLKEEIERQESHISYEIKNGYVHFEEEILKKQKEMMKSLLNYLGEIPLLHLLSSPFIYAMIIPAMLFDLLLFFYQQVIFRIYGFSFVRRRDFIVFDRHYLHYLNIIERVNCMYCSYFNGLMRYAVEIAAKTEFYFCPIKHAKKTAYQHRYYKEFLVYGDECDYQKNLKELREKLQKQQL
jgi:hypothetical protein